MEHLDRIGQHFAYFLGYWVNFGKFVTKIFIVSGKNFLFTFTSGKNCDLNGRIFTPAYIVARLFEIHWRFQPQKNVT